MSGPRTVKISFLGDTNVGKTTLITRFKTGEFVGTLPNTAGTSFVNITHHSELGQIDLHFIDTAGQEKYATLLPQPIRDTHIFVICYSIDDKSSFESIKIKWLSLINEYKSENTRYTVIVACKDDLVDQAVVDENKAQDLADEINAKFYPTSSKTGDGVSELLSELKKLAEKIDQETPAPVPIQIDQKNSNKKCC